MVDDTRIVVRDRRSMHQFSIHNRVVDEWFPIINASLRMKGGFYGG